jgi:hypothetical protein
LQTVNIGEALGKLYVEKCFLLRQKQKRKRWYIILFGLSKSINN